MFLAEDLWRYVNAALATADFALLLVICLRLWNRWNRGERFTRLATLVLLGVIAERSIQFAVYDYTSPDLMTATATAALGWMLWGLILVIGDIRRGVAYGHGRRS